MVKHREEERVLCLTQGLDKSVDLHAVASDPGLAELLRDPSRHLREQARMHTFGDDQLGDRQHDLQQEHKRGDHLLLAEEADGDEAQRNHGLRELLNQYDELLARR
eukprot:8443265-Heterocapsa_arctica.AAC.1